MTVAGKEQLQGWKEIATFLGRDERTAKRWEKQRGLPVRRIPGAGRANVYALVPELQAWLVAAPPAEFPDAPADIEPAAQGDDPALPLSGNLAQAASVPEVVALPERSLRGRALLMIAVLALAAAGGWALVHRRSVSPAPASPLARRYLSPVAGADELYLHGVYLYEERTPTSLEKARLAFAAAIGKDPRHAPAYAGLAQTYLMLREYATLPSAEAYGLARAAAERAVQLDPELAEAHATLGFIDFFSSRWDTAGAATEFATALRLDPRLSLTHHWYGSMLTHQARYAEALAELNEAQRLQPTSLPIQASQAFALGLGGHRDEARRKLDDLTAVEPAAASAHRSLAILSAVTPADLPRYLKELRLFAEMRHDADTLDFVHTASAAYARGGAQAMWQAALDRELALHPDPAHPSYRMGDIYAAMGDEGHALTVFEHLAATRDDSLIGLALDPWLVHMRTDPRFVRLLVLTGLDANAPGSRQMVVAPR